MASTKLSLKLLIDKSTDKSTESKIFISLTISRSSVAANGLLLPLIPPPSSASSKKHFKCASSNDGPFSRSFPTEPTGFGLRRSSNCKNFVTEYSGTPCPNCKCLMTTEMTNVLGTQELVPVVVDSSKGLVKGVVTYTIMENLSVSPMSSISSITLLSEFNVRNICHLEERTANLRFDEGI
ncbi:hypothetical protein Cni_G15643 [Canna indica]|uniref:Uncharacterized protein n=1 Tax=Canna indica TaxID=4628 RepID=A0AAQ3KHE1_9LILI|nr:hypothetical protein Cni_G15643 [Canna indica]